MISAILLESLSALIVHVILLNNEFWNETLFRDSKLNELIQNVLCFYIVFNSTTFL